MASERFIHRHSGKILVVLGILSFGAAGFLLSYERYTLSATLLIVGFIIVRTLLKIYDSVNLITASFFESLCNDDTTVHYSVNQDNKSQALLYNSLNHFNEHFRELRMKNEYNELYYKSLIQNSSAGLLVLNKENHIEMINRMACNFAGISPDSTNPDLLKIKHPSFFDAICNMKPGENLTYRNIVGNNIQMLSFRSTMIKRQDTELKLVSIQDIRSELEARELDSYRKLINVMTHEIMNLVTPLTTVAKELSALYNIPEEKIDTETFKTTLTGLKMIDEQSNGLLKFVNNYRKISKLPKPEFTDFDPEEWTEQLNIVFAGKMKEEGISFSVICDKSLKHIVADKNLLNQVMINLINNSFDAVREIDEERKIEIRIGRSLLNKVMIKVINNGPKIPPGIQEKIFVPFFTTKINGSGIGLSICQEIMKMHNGSIVIVQAENDQTCFVIEF